MMLVLLVGDTLHPEIFVCMSAEHSELHSAALQSVGPVVQQHTADWSVHAQWMAGAKLWSLWADLGSAGLQVSTTNGPGPKQSLDTEHDEMFLFPYGTCKIQILFSCSLLSIVSFPSLNLFTPCSVGYNHHGNTKREYA